MKRQVVVPVGLAVLLAVLMTGFFVGRWTRHPVPGSDPPGNGAASRHVYTCSMHPQVRLTQPGNCPICEMPLVPAGSASSSEDAMPVFSLSEQALAMASVETTPVAYRELSRALQAVGKVHYHEPSLATVTARVDGYAEKLFVNVTGVNVKAGDHLVEIYSPDLLVAEQELLIALREGADSPLVEGAKVKLRNWGLTAKQIGELATSRTIADRVTLYTPIAGTVIEKTVIENSAFKAGDVLYRIANLDTVWVYLDIYEFDLSWVRHGQPVEITTEAYPGQLFTGMVTFVEPVLNEQTRTVRVPVHVANEGHVLKPGMYARAVIRAVLGADGRAAPTGIEGKYTCPMHPQVVQDAAGACPMCHMPLEQITGGAAPGAHDHPAPAQEARADQFACPMKCEGDRIYDQPGQCPACNMKLEKVALPVPPAKGGQKGLLAVPVAAVLDSGTRHLVYVERGRGTFEAREVTLGPRCDGYFPVLKGLDEGERVVSRGGLLIDSQFQITGHPSLYYPGGLHASPERPDEAGPTQGTETPADARAMPSPEAAIQPAGGHGH